MAGPEADPNLLDPVRLGEAVGNIAARSHDLMQEFLERQQRSFGSVQWDPLGVGNAFLQLTTALVSRPEKLVELHWQTWNAYMKLWLDTAGRMLGHEQEAETGPASGRPDRRFKHEAWDKNPFFEFIKQSYEVAADTILDTVAGTEGLDSKTAHKVQFYTRQFVNALSPTNFIATNPEVLQTTLESHGENLLNGLRNFVKDFDPESGQLRIRMTDAGAFELGHNVAVSRGKVIYQNELIQLLQYEPSTQQVFRRPLLVMPPWINKYYILDLQPKNSLVKWLVDQGHTVFVISWVNPDESLANMDFADYVFKGPLAALDAVAKATGEKEANIIGYCIGGTLLGATLAWMQARKDTRFVSATFLTTLLDFSEPGDLGVFVDEHQLENLERDMNERGYHEGAEMATTFNMLRSNDLIWSFYVNNYLLGKDPLPFDLLYWNSDSTRMPAKMHSTYLRTMYLQNRFKEPGGMVVGDVPIDLSAITTPSYFLSTEEDHIAPWRGTYLGAGLLGGPVRFVLGKSGHIAGVVNPPAAGKYGYYTDGAVDVPADQWLQRAQAHEGSWWPDWQAWVETHAGDKVPARRPGDGELQPLEDTPGSYVKVRA